MSLFVKSVDFKLRLFNVNVSRYAHSLNYDYQYWQKSIIPTLHFQRSLPRLPIPKLELTCERYLAAQRPLLNNDAYTKTEDQVKAFQFGIGKTLQKILIEQDRENKYTSYISKPWFDMYLSDRMPLPLNYNPMLVFTNDPKTEYNDQAIRATNMLISSLRFYKSLKSNILEPEVFHLNPAKSDNKEFRKLCSIAPSFVSWYVAYLYKAYPLDMSQYNNLFCTTRIPEEGKDSIKYKPGSKHVSVQSKGHFYVFDVLDNNGNILSPNVLLANIKCIIDDNIKEAEHAIGIFTTLERDSWAKIRKTLVANGNENELNLIDSSLFHICLDSNTIGDDPYDLTRSFLHGDGKNRWFDKSISLQLSKDGAAAVNFEHSWGDGVAVLRYFQDIHKDSLENPQIHPNSTPDTSRIENVRKLDLKLTDALRQEATKAEDLYRRKCQSLDINYTIINGIGKKLCKEHSISPDAVMQLAFQAAFYKQYGKFVGSYESCSTAAFKHGRTETIRPCTMATKTYSEGVNSNNSLSDGELKELIMKCSKLHGALTRDAAMGQGFDRHLFALKLIANNINEKRTEIFDDPSYHNLNYHVLSTSTLSSPSVWAGGFGPVVTDGYGIGYVIRDDSLGVLVTSYPPNRDGKGFIDSLNITFKDILRVLEKTKNC